MTRFLAFTIAMALALPFTALAQAKPDFSGTWTLDQAKSDPPPQRGGGGGGRGAAGGGSGRGMGGPVVIKQDANTITIGEATYKLDGSESTVTMQGRGGPQEVKARARLEGSNLVIESTREIQGFSISTKEVRSVQGNEMTVVTTTSTPQGDITRKTVFTKG